MIKVLINVAKQDTLRQQLYDEVDLEAMVSQLALSGLPYQQEALRCIQVLCRQEIKGSQQRVIEVGGSLPLIRCSNRITNTQLQSPLVDMTNASVSPLPHQVSACPHTFATRLPPSPPHTHTNNDDTHTQTTTTHTHTQIIEVS